MLCLNDIMRHDDPSMQQLLRTIEDGPHAHAADPGRVAVSACPEQHSHHNLRSDVALVSRAMRDTAQRNSFTRKLWRRGPAPSVTSLRQMLESCEKRAEGRRGSVSRATISVPPTYGEPRDRDKPSRCRAAPLRQFWGCLLPADGSRRNSSQGRTDGGIEYGESTAQTRVKADVHTVSASSHFIALCRAPLATAVSPSQSLGFTGLSGRHTSMGKFWLIAMSAAMEMARPAGEIRVYQQEC